MIKFPEYESFDGLGLANLVKSGVISPVELLEAAIERVSLWNPKLNAVVHPLYDFARQAVQSEIPTGLFQGVPFLLKDLLAEYAGAPLSAGSRFVHGFMSTKDNEMVKRFKKSGVIIFGKTNTPELGTSFVTEPELFGPTRNPWDLARTVGGSSGGSAAAVAAGIVPVAHANDGAGSIRVPSAYCGVFGLKPSRGRTPVGPDVMRVWQGMVVEHVISRSVRDSAAMLDVLAGPELGSPISLPPAGYSFLAALEDRPVKLRIAFMEEAFFPAKVSEEHKKAVQDAASLCQQLGHIVEPAALKINNCDEVMQAFMTVVAAEFASLMKVLSKLMGKKPRRIDLELLNLLTYQIGINLKASDFVLAMKVFDRVERELAEYFQEYDVLITPTMPGPPPLIGELQPKTLEKIVLQLFSYLPFNFITRGIAKQLAARCFEVSPFTPLFNITGQPAMSVPLYWDKQGLPIGIQFAARMGDEKTLLQLAHQLEKAKPWVNILRERRGL